MVTVHGMFKLIKITVLHIRTVAPEQIWKWGRPVRSKSRGAPMQRKVPKFVLEVVPLNFLALKAQLVILLNTFMMVSTVWSVSCSLFFYLWFPPCPAICKSGGGHVSPSPPFPIESAPLQTEYERLPYRYCTVGNFCWISYNRSRVASMSTKIFRAVPIR